jgi:hypothetical protein
MTAAKLPIEAWRKRLAPAPAQGQGSGGFESACRGLIGFVPPCCQRHDSPALDRIAGIVTAYG